MPRLPTWRVRVRRSMETYVEIQATSATEAEAEAQNRPGVTQVFGRSAMRVDQALAEPPIPGVRE